MTAAEVVVVGLGEQGAGAPEGRAGAGRPGLAPEGEGAGWTEGCGRVTGAGRPGLAGCPGRATRVAGPEYFAARFSTSFTYHPAWLYA